MSSLWTDLLFLHGHIRDPELARRLANMPAAPTPGSTGKYQSPLTALASLCTRLCLGIGDGHVRRQ